MIMCTYALYTIFYACFSIQTYWYTCIYLISNLLSFSLYYLSVPVPACLEHITWSCTCVPVMHAIWLYHMYSLGLLTTLDSQVQILESGPWWLGCNWSECTADPPVVIGVQQKLEHRRSSSSQLFSCLALEAPLVVSWASLSFYYVHPFMYCTLVFSSDVIFL